ncbi:DeoR/GlpR family DNA-binding transcription regulator [Cutibacterium sp. V947]|uniref:DeoR/GlpR family DNA-binding transcription regulator n=1 Tax=unclassified Cutibacterium TaxID=2649671 RepID=UPI003EE2DD08
MKEMRQDQLATLLAGRDTCTVTELAAAVDASVSTVRRDLDEMARSGRIRRVRGGAMAAHDRSDSDENNPFQVVLSHNRPSKDAIARRAAELVKDGDSVIIDIGTTTCRLAHYLVGRPLTVFTSSLPVLDEFRHDSTTEVIVIGGKLRRSYQSLVGVITEDVLARISANWAFLGTSGVSRGRVLDTSYVEVGIKRSILTHADRTVLLADHDKFPGSGNLEVAPVGDFSVLVTDSATPDGVINEIREADVEVLLA